MRQFTIVLGSKYLRKGGRKEGVGSNSRLPGFLNSRCKYLEINKHQSLRTRGRN